MSTMFQVSTNDGIAIITLDVPGRSMNVIGAQMLADLAAWVDEAAADSALCGVVITSAKRDFIAGADILEMIELYDEGLTLQQGYERSQVMSRLLRRIETCGKPFAAAINGLALGGGFELCLACHYRVLNNEPRVVVGLPEVKIGLLPGAGGTQRVPRLIGIAEAMKLLTDGRHVRPAEALKLGLVHELAAPDRVIETARRWLLERADPVQPWDKKGFSVPGGAGTAASQMYTLGAARIAADTQHNFPAPLAILSSLYEGTVLPMDLALQIESKYFAKLVTGVVARNLMRTSFVNKGLADKLARRPADVPKSVVRKLGVLGAGMMGGGIAYSAACAGIDVVLLDTSMELADKGRARIADLLAKERARGTRSAPDAEAALQRIRVTSQFEHLVGCEFIIEAVFEQRDIKEQVIRQAETVLDERVVFASNTSTLPIGGLAALSLRPNQFIGLHFFSPVEKMPLVEVIVAKATSNATLARALDLVGQLRKTPIVVNDGRGFYTSRIFGTFVHEGMRMLEEGIAPALIENAARMAGMAVGPLAVSDEVSIELLWKVISQSAQDLGSSYVKPPGYSVVQRFVVTLGRLGRRHGAGFYDYPPGLPKRLWRGLADIYARSHQQPGAEEIKKRLLYIQALESARCFEEGVMAHPADADLGSILGWGFPSWTGGTLSLIETVGLKAFVADCDRLAALHGDRFAVSDWLRQRAERDQKFYDLPTDRSVRVA